MTLSELGVSTRWANKFAEAGITTVGDVLTRSREELLSVPGIGDKAVDELSERLAECGVAIV
jgi:DNA-directed RNA polymerase subunit beta'